jgi:hypothetical protein
MFRRSGYRFADQEYAPRTAGVQAASRSRTGAFSQ